MCLDDPLLSSFAFALRRPRNSVSDHLAPRGVSRPAAGAGAIFPPFAAVAAACCERAGVDGRAHETLWRQHVNTRKVVGVLSSCAKSATARYVCVLACTWRLSRVVLLTPPRFVCPSTIPGAARMRIYKHTYIRRVRARCYLFLLSFFFFYTSAGGFYHCSRTTRRRRR